MGKLKDLTGMKFGHLTVRYRGENSKNGQTRWWCECDCDNPELILVQSGNLKNGHTTSCGKCQKFEDLTGQIFWNWLVLKRAEDYISPKGEKYVQWLCECQCQKKTHKVIRASILKNGGNKSCGCLHENTYDLTGEYGIGYTSKGEEFWFDLEDYDKIKNYCWYIDDREFVKSNTIINNKRTIIYMHRLIMDVTDTNIDVDHIKHKRYDNRKSQLRVATSSQNIRNSKLSKNNTSGITGVWKDNKTNKWQAEIMLHKEKIYLGQYDTKEEAAKIRKEAEEKYFGEWSYDNSQKHDINEN